MFTAKRKRLGMNPIKRLWRQFSRQRAATPPSSQPELALPAEQNTGAGGRAWQPPVGRLPAGRGTGALTRAGFGA